MNAEKKINEGTGNFNKADFLGIKLCALNRAEMADKILEFSLNSRGKFITYLNAHCVNISFIDPEYKKILQTADLVYAGGQGVVWASRLLGASLPERVNILDFFDRLIKKLIDERITLFLLGGMPNIVRKAGLALKEKGVRVIGCRDGFFDKKEEPAIIEQIKTLKPNILMVGMGVPKQEKWIYAHLDELNVNLCWAVGGVFDLLSGRLKRAPSWVRNCGLEWLYLGAQDGRRLLKRYLLGNPIFIYRILKYRKKKFAEAN